MKKIILTLFAGLFILQGAMSCSAEETTGFFTTLKNAIVKDVQDTVTTTVTTAANKTLNIVKINQYKQQLEQKKQELSEMEASHRNFIYKFFQRRRINNEIREIEAQIRALGGQV